MKRIRYKKHANGTLESGMLDTPAGMVRVTLNPETFVGTLVGGEVNGVTSVEAGSLQQLKKLVKQSLVDLGVVFEDETRVRSSRVITEDTV